MLPDDGLIYDTALSGQGRVLMCLIRRIDDIDRRLAAVERVISALEIKFMTTDEKTAAFEAIAKHALSLIDESKWICSVKVN